MTLYFAFDSPDEPIAKEDMGWPEATVSMYDDTFENPYEVPNAVEKIEAAIDALPEPPHTYQNRKYWVRIEYYPLVENGEVIRQYD
jgi:hypothetical protein